MKRQTRTQVSYGYAVCSMLMNVVRCTVYKLILAGLSCSHSSCSCVLGYCDAANLRNCTGFSTQPQQEPPSPPNIHKAHPECILIPLRTMRFYTGMHGWKHFNYVWENEVIFPLKIYSKTI